MGIKKKCVRARAEEQRVAGREAARWLSACGESGHSAAARPGIRGPPKQKAPHPPPPLRRRLLYATQYSILIGGA